ncbi:MAG TPA: phage terminase large subunit [Armatimonadota bacterium]|nr:phage terminase large subunit [Armatimonadota bacterium]
MTATVIRPQKGPQEVFLATPADIAVYGGSAGGGKTWALLLEVLRHVHNPGFGAVIFRRESPQIRNEGGLWDESMKLYPLLGARPREAMLDWRFPSGARLKFAHLQYEKDKQEWQGAQVPLLGFDELTHFTESQFFYLLSRNRSVCGVRPYVRATTNPDPLSWVKTFLAPWLDRQHPEPAQSGELRWFIRDGGQILWVPRGTPDAKSVTFVRASIFDNRILLAKDPGYLANLKAMSLVDRKRLLEGDWEIVEGGNMFRREWFGTPLDAAPAGLRLARYWDLAATEVKPGKDPDWTVGTLMGLSSDGYVYLLDVQRVRATPGAVEKLIRQTAELDRDRHGSVDTLMEEEGGSSGIAVTDHYARRVLLGFPFRGIRSTGPKEERAKPFSAQAEAGNVRLVRGPWNHDWLNELVAFPNPEVHDDQVDSASGAFNYLAMTGRRQPLAVY